LAKDWPALDVPGVGDPDLLLALLDDFSPTAVQEHASGIRVFFATADARDRAIAAVAGGRAVDVSDEDWARRSQENLAPVVVGRITINPNSESPTTTNPKSPIPNPEHIAIVIPPSMAFGTGHHATTRLCLAALQTIDLAGRFVIDVGTGSGVLALAAVVLGARGALGIDNDGDAIAAARENLARNPHAGSVRFVELDFRTADCGEGQVVTANLTGSMLATAAAALAKAVAPAGHLIASGLLIEEADDVLAAFAPKMKRVWQSEEDGWIGLVLVKK
jgi:ribosomal protein L11 methyltransferase